MGPLHRIGLAKFNARIPNCDNLFDRSNNGHHDYGRESQLIEIFELIVKHLKQLL